MIIINKKKLLLFLVIILSFTGSGIVCFSAFGIAVTPVRIIGIICLILIIIQHRGAKKNVHMLLIVAYAYIVLTTLLFSPAFTRAFSLLLDYLCAFSMMVFVQISVETKDDYRFSVKSFAWATLITIIICFYEYLTSTHIANNYASDTVGYIHTYLSKAPTAFLYNPNNVAVLMVLAIPLLLRIPKLYANARGTIVAYALIILDIATIFMTGSRGALVSALVLLALFLFTSKLKMWKKLLIILCGVGLAVYFSQFIFAQMAYGGMMKNGVIDILGEGDGGRGIIAKNAINKVFCAYPLFGAGAGGVEIITGASAHNMFVEVLCNYGICGMILFVALLGVMLKNLLKHKEYRVVSGLFFIAFVLCTQIPPTMMLLHFVFVEIALQMKGEEELA